MKTIALLSVIGVMLFGCTRKVDEKSKITLQLPTNPVQKGVSAKTSSGKVGVFNTAGAPPWNTSLNPTASTDINCYAVFVGGPEEFMSESTCGDTATGEVKMRFGPNAGFFPAGALLNIDVPSGPNRSIFVAGVKSSAATCGTLEQPDFTNMSIPHILAEKKMDLPPGDVFVDMSVTLDTNNTFDTCDFVIPPDNGGCPGGICPKLVLDFLDPANLDPLVNSNYVRVDTPASNVSSFVNSSGFIEFDVNATLKPRINHNSDPGIGHVPLGILIEESRVNELAMTEDVSNPTSWGSGLGNMSAGSTAPDGVTASKRFDDDQTGTGVSRLQSIAVATGDFYTFSMFIKKGSSNFAIVDLFQNTIGNCAVVVDLTTGAFLSAGSKCATVAGGAQKFRDGWFRVWTTYENTSSAQALDASFQPAFANTLKTTPDNIAMGDADFWGAQLEKGAFPTSYIRNLTTTAGASTRGADDMIIPTIQIPDFNAAEGTVMVGFVGDHHAMLNSPAPTLHGLLSIGEITGPGNNINLIYDRANSLAGFHQESGGSQNFLHTGTHNWLPFEFNKFAFSFKSGNHRLAVNGSTMGSDPNVLVPAPLDQIRLGRKDSGAYFNGHILHMEYFDQAAPANILEDLSTP